MTTISKQGLQCLQKLSFFSHLFDGKLLHLTVFQISFVFVLDRPEWEFWFLPMAFAHDQVIRTLNSVDKKLFSLARLGLTPTRFRHKLLKSHRNVSKCKLKKNGLIYCYMNREKAKKLILKLKCFTRYSLISMSRH